ncbi:Bre1 [Drosophila busckii]|uniref:E3 ubiquitin protein ligase n=1 Tax=Drosophila busckii TaxID=30019 RepID=A0A0M5IYR9_DROBS|nr:E3 ubiquitin-protein ligase Bre1 [Drosophila busckii]XP_017843867.1 E3 ubiquitin-protein ligase Bre1 [Drosophila busckii]ALC44111.1 Bre1 [Drosophila busckii]
MSKRSADDASGAGSGSSSCLVAAAAAGQPPIKKVHFEPHLIGPVSTLEEMDIKVLEFQNKKLAQRIEQRMRCEAELRHRIEQLEKRQTQDDAVLNVVNRYWNQLNEDIRVLLQRFDAETADELENKNENEVTTSFLTQLSTWDKEELDEKLANRVQVSKRAVAKIVQVIDRLMQRNEKITHVLRGDALGGAGSTAGTAAGDDEQQKAAAAGDAVDAASVSAGVHALEETLKKTHIEIMTENRNLQNLNTSLHEKFHTMSLKMKEYQDALTAKETENAELKNQIDELQYDLEKIHCRNDKLENHLAEAIEKLKAYHQIYGDPNKSTNSTKTPNTSSGSITGGSTTTTNVNSQHLEELQKELEEHRELANNRLQELDKLHATHRETLKEVEKLKMDIRQLPESVIVETTEYKCLQSQFSVLYNESMQIKTMLDETRNQLQTSKNQHLRQIEVMESEELIAQKKVRSEMIQMEDVLALIRKEYEALRIEFEQNMAANEQTAPINREMRHLITSLQNHNGQLKGEVQRYKRKYKDLSTDNLKLRKELDEALVTIETNKQEQLSAAAAAAASEAIKQESAGYVKEEHSSSTAAGVNCSSNAGNTSSDCNMSIKEENSVCAEDELDDEAAGKDAKDPAIKQEKLCANDVVNAEKKDSPGPANATTSAAAAASTSNSVKSERDSKDGIKSKELKALESEAVRELKAQLKKALNDQKEMKLLLDMYKGVSKDQRDKVQLMATEKKLRSEIEELRQQLKKLQESKREERKKLADEEALRKIKQLEEQKYELQKQVANHKPNDSSWGAAPGGSGRPFVGSHEEEALLNEMEVTGQAFEDMQEQNSRLIQQLREKDDANFKLMSERIKANQLHKLLREEKTVLEDQMATATTQIEAMHIVLRKLEEKERSLQATVASIEKELMLRQQAMEMHKRKAIESAQSAADLKLHLEKYHAQMKEAQQVVAEKTSSLEAEAYKTKRLQEELAQFKRKAERMKKMEMSGTTIDEVMIEEIREYKETLTCPSCKVKRKDAVLSKCFHVFCYDCLRTRYETRQRKCPKCNCAFGANDYHRLYLQ